jgi:hypothetical protein
MSSQPCSPEERARIDAWGKDLKRLLSINAANKHLARYAMDEDPRHILRAVLIRAELGEPLNEIMLRNLRHAIRLLDNPKRKNGRPRRNTARDQRILQSVYTVYQDLPEKVDEGLISRITRNAGISRGAFFLIYGRARKKLNAQTGGSITPDSHPLLATRHKTPGTCVP